MRAELSLSDERHFALAIGKRHHREEIFGNADGIPVYSANVSKPFGYALATNIDDFSCEYVLWGIDGDFMFNVIPKGAKFATTDHCGSIKILNPEVVPEYLRYQLELQGHALGFDRGLRASLANMSRVVVRFPTTADGRIDRGAQLALVEKFLAVRALKDRLDREAEMLSRLIVSIPAEGEYMSIAVGDLFDLTLTTNRSTFTKRFVNEHPGTVPVFSASGEESIPGYGFVADGLPGVKYFENVLTWNIDGSKFRAFFRKGRFSLSEKVIPLVLRPEWQDSVAYDYVRHILDRKALEAGAAYQNKPGKGRIKDLELEIPAKQGEGGLVLDLERQRGLASLYERVYETRDQLVRTLLDLSASYVEV